MNKITINSKMYDVVSNEEYLANTNLYNDTLTAIERDGLVYPLRKKKDTNPGYYKFGIIGVFIPPTQEEIEQYSSQNSINFSNSKTVKDILEKSDRLKELERNILTTADDITIPKIKDNDEPEMVALKRAITAKQIDINKYEHRFGGKFNNDIRILQDSSVTLFKLKKYANALDMKCTLTIEDKNPGVPNPMNQKISVILNNGDDTNE